MSPTLTVLWPTEMLQVQRTTLESRNADLQLVADLAHAANDQFGEAALQLQYC